MTEQRIQMTTISQSQHIHLSKVPERNFDAELNLMQSVLYTSEFNIKSNVLKISLHFAHYVVLYLNYSIVYACVLRCFNEFKGTSR